eukprot:403342660
MLKKVAVFSLLALHVLSARLEIKTDTLRNYIAKEGQFFEKLVAAQWRSRQPDSKFSMDLNKMRFENSQNHEGVDVVVPGSLENELVDSKVEFEWVLTASQVRNSEYNPYPNEPFSYSDIRVIGDIHEYEEQIQMLNQTLDIIQDTFFGTWEARVWEQVQPLSKILRFQYYWMLNLAGKIEVENDKFVLHFRNEDYRYPIPEITRQVPQVQANKDIRFVIDPELLNSLWSRNISMRQSHRFRATWTRNASEYNETMTKLFNSTILQHLIPKGFEELGQDVPLDLNVNTYMVYDTDKKYVSEGENHFTINDNIFDFLSTFSYELIQFTHEERFGGWVWKLFRQGYFKLNLKGSFTQKSATVFNLKLSGDMINSIIYDFSEQLTNEEQTLADNIKSLSELYKDGIDIDISPVLDLFPCFGLDPQTFEAAIEDNQIVVSVNLGNETRVCDITQNMAKQTGVWSNEIDMHKFRFMHLERQNNPKFDRQAQRENRQQKAESNQQNHQMRKKNGKKREKFEDL